MFSKLRKRKQARRPVMLVRNCTRDRILADAAEVADTGPTRRKGLLGRDGLHAGEALWITPCEAVHTWGMKFPIDVLYLDRKKRVRKVRKAMGPWRVSACLFAHSVLELPSGSITQTETRVGDQLAFESGGNHEGSPEQTAARRAG